MSFLLGAILWRRQYRQNRSREKRDKEFVRRTAAKARARSHAVKEDEEVDSDEEYSYTYTVSSSSVKRVGKQSAASSTSAYRAKRSHGSHSYTNAHSGTRMRRMGRSLATGRHTSSVKGVGDAERAAPRTHNEQWSFSSSESSDSSESASRNAMLPRQASTFGSQGFQSYSYSFGSSHGEKAQPAKAVASKPLHVVRVEQLSSSDEM